MKADLLRQRLNYKGNPVWRFAALSEYEQFDIRGKQMQGNVIEYDVSMRLVDIPSEARFLADALIVYRQAEGGWELISVLIKLFERVSSGTY
jgi:hypothetical protein